MFKKIIQKLLGVPGGYVSPDDQFLARVRERYPKPSASQAKSIRESAEIASRRDGQPQ